MSGFGFYLLLQSFLWQPAYGAVVPHNPRAVLAAWQNSCCYCCQTQYFCPLVLDCLKKSDRLSPNSWSFHRCQKINLQKDPHLCHRFCNKQLFKATGPERGRAPAAGRAWPWTRAQCSPLLRSQSLPSITLHISGDQFKANPMNPAATELKHLCWNCMFAHILTGNNPSALQNYCSWLLCLIASLISVTQI